MLWPEAKVLLKQLSLILEGVAAWWLYALFRLLPTSWCSAFGVTLGRFQGAEEKDISSRIERNLSWLMPSINQADRLNLVDEVLKNVGQSYFETMIVDRLLSEGDVDTCLPEHLHLTLDNGTPLILVTVHLANLGDLMSATLSNLLFRNYSYLYGASPTRPIDNTLLQKLTSQIRNNYLQSTPGHSSSPDFKTTRDYVRALQKPGSFVIFHLDEAYDCQVHFPTFGRPIDSRGNLIKVIKLSAKTGALIQPVYMTRAVASPRFRLMWLPAIEVESDGVTLSKPTLMRHAQQLNDLFEPRVFENLADWAQICYLRSPQKTN